jgi:ribonuclease D
MQTLKLPPPIWIDTPAELRDLAGDLHDWRRVAVDTESNSLHAYREQLCLLQFSTPKADYLLDPLVLKDLSTLKPFFANPHIEKIFHAAEYDLICLKRDSNICVANLFDTMQAARILGYARVGLDSILEERLGIMLDKKYQKADWGKRPLSTEMLNYARLDTHHLFALRDYLEAELKSRGRTQLAAEEFLRLSAGNGSGNGKVEIPAWQRIKGARNFTDRQLTILQELCAWREKQAQKMDRPQFKVMDDKRLADIAEHLPGDNNGLSNLGLTDRQIQLFGGEILLAVRRGRNSRLVSRPRPFRRNQATLDRLNNLSEWRKAAGLKIGVESDIILPKNWMNLVAEKNPRNLNDLAALLPNSPWRLEQFGEQILKALAGKITRSGPIKKKRAIGRNTPPTRTKD